MSLSLHPLNLSKYILQKKLLSQNHTCICFSKGFTIIDWSMHILTERLQQVHWDIKDASLQVSENSPMRECIQQYAEVCIILVM